MRKYTGVVRFIYEMDVEVEAENEEQARELACEQFTGDEDYKVVHAEEFINDIDEVAP